MFTRNPHIHLFVDNISFLNGKRFFLKEEALIIQGMLDGTFYCYFMHKQNPVAIPHESESKILFRGSKVMKREVESGSVVLYSSYIILDNDYTNIIVKNHARRAIYCFMIFNRERQIFASILSKYERIIIVGKLNIKIEIENCIQEPYQISAASFVMPERILLLQEESEA